MNCFHCGTRNAKLRSESKAQSFWTLSSLSLSPSSPSSSFSQAWPATSAIWQCKCHRRCGWSASSCEKHWSFCRKQCRRAHPESSSQTCRGGRPEKGATKTQKFKLGTPSKPLSCTKTHTF